MFGILDVSTSGLAAQRTALEVAAGNIASKDAVEFHGGEAVPYRRKTPLFSTIRQGASAGGVRVSKVVEDTTPFGLRHDPTHPYAAKSGKDAGYVRTSNVDYSVEMVNAMTAARAYEANLTVIEMTKSMAAATLRLIG